MAASEGRVVYADQVGFQLRKKKKKKSRNRESSAVAVAVGRFHGKERGWAGPPTRALCLHQQRELINREREREGRKEDDDKHRTLLSI